MCSNASITEILGINDKNLVISGNEKENIKGIEYTVLRGESFHIGQLAVLNVV